jgi:methylmalonyl-CoA/ethylmalonyl-CoA epimerase
MNHRVFRSLDHLAIVVENTEESLKLWRDQLGLQVLFSEEVNAGAIRLTHLDLGNTHLQLVEPLLADHPLRKWLMEHGPGLHHVCFQVDNVDTASGELTIMGLTASNAAHQGTKGKRALFLDVSSTQGIPLEITGN